MARSMETIIFKRGRVFERRRLKVQDNLLVDSKARRAYVIGSAAVPELKRSLGFPVRGRVFMINETVTDVMPLSRQGYKRTDKQDVYDLEDLGLYRETQRLKSGDREPEHAKWLGYGVVIMVLGVVLVGAATMWQWAQGQGWV